MSKPEMTFSTSSKYPGVFFHFNGQITSENRWSNKLPHYPILHQVLNFMVARGFCVGRDPKIQEHYKCLNKDHWYGRKGDLEFKAERYPAGWRIEFFQNIVFENRNGGEYDFGKFEKMPYLIKLLFLNETRHIARFLSDLGVEDTSRPVYKLAEDKIKEHIVTKQFDVKFKSPAEFNLGDHVCSSAQYAYNRTDRDGKEIQNGEVKYLRWYDGRLRRGRVYHNINNMWWVVFNRFDYSNEACFRLFDLTPEDLVKRRVKEHNPPKEYIERRKAIDETKVSELIAELRRRGVKVG